MTAPLTPPPHGSSDHDPWQTAAGHPGTSPDSGRSDVGRGVLVTVAVALSGALLGVLWLWLAPRVPLISDGENVFLQHTEGEEAVGADGTFVLLALAFGTVAALVVFLCLRRGGIPVVIGLALGSLLGSAIAWRAGVMFGPTPDVAAHAREVGRGVVFDAPLQLRAKGALLAWPVAATAVHLALTGFFGPRDPEPVPPGLWPDQH